MDRFSATQLPAATENAATVCHAPFSWRSTRKDFDFASAAIRIGGAVSPDVRTGRLAEDSRITQESPPLFVSSVA
jgi:hypothetical protein